MMTDNPVEFYSLNVIYSSGIRFYGKFDSLEQISDFINLELQKLEGENDFIVAIYIEAFNKKGFYLP